MATVPKALGACRVCRSRRWHQDENGYFVCELGHQSQEYHEEEGDVEGATGFGLVRRKLKRVRPATTSDDSRAEAAWPAPFAVYRGLQELLRLQVAALVTEHGIDPRLDDVVRELWLVYLARSHALDHIEPVASADGGGSAPPDDEPEAKSALDMADLEKQLKGLATHPAARSRRTPNVSDTDSDNDGDGLEDMEEEEEEEDERAKHPATLDDAGEHMGGDDDESFSYSDGEGDEPKTDYRRRRTFRADPFPNRSAAASASVPNPRIRDPHLHETLAICYLGCVWLRAPVTLVDLLVWVAVGRLPYLAVFPLLSEAVRQQLSGDETKFFRTRRMPGVTFLHMSVSWIARLLQAPVAPVDPHTAGSAADTPSASAPPPVPSLTFPPVNSTLLVGRFVRLLGLPEVLMPCALRLLHLDERRHWTLNPATASRDMPCHVPVVAWVVVAAKLAYGLGAVPAVEAADGALPTTAPASGGPSSTNVTNRERMLRSLTQRLGAALASEILFAMDSDAASDAMDDAEVATDNKDDVAAALAGVAGGGVELAVDGAGDGAAPPDARLGDRLPPWSQWRARVAPWFAGTAPVASARIPWHDRDLDRMTPAAVREYTAFAATAIVADAIIPAPVDEALKTLHSVERVRGSGSGVHDGNGNDGGSQEPATQPQDPPEPERISFAAWKAATLQDTRADADATALPLPAAHVSAAYTHYSYNSWFASDRPVPQKSPAGLGEALLPTPLSRPEPAAATSELHAAYGELLAVAAWRAGVTPEALHRVVHTHEKRLQRLAARFPYLP